MIHITALDIEQWADRITASSDLPRLISQLIWASAKDLSQLDMPGGELTRLGGFDGLVECSEGDDIVPAGLSAWELSVERNCKGKADDDYEKRTNDPIHVKINTSTFIFATPRRWANMQDWINEKAQRNEWRDVKALRSTDLAKWLSRSPWIAASFGESIGKPLSGIKSLDMIWLEYSTVPFFSAGGILDPAFVVGERSDLGKTLLNWLAAEVPPEKREMMITGPSVKEVLHYIAATVHSLEATEREKLESRIFAVFDQAVAQSLGLLERSHVILVEGGEALPYVLAKVRKTGCRVIIVHNGQAGLPIAPQEGETRLELQPMSRNVLINAVVRLGRTPEEAHQLCAQCGFAYDRVRREMFLH